MSELTVLTAYIIKTANGDKVSRGEFCEAMNSLATLARKANNNGLGKDEVLYLSNLILENIEKGNADEMKSHYRTFLKLKEIMEELQK